MKDNTTDTDFYYGWLSGTEIKRQWELKNIVIDPFEIDLINPNSYNYRLSPVIKRLTNSVIDLKGEDTYEEITIGHDGLTLLPHECYLGCTLEVFGSDKFASLITGRSSVGRKFITNHITAGLIDIGFVGQVTLEITVIKPTIVYPEIPFGQIFWFSVMGQPELYSGKYNHQSGPTTSRMHLTRHSRQKNR